MDPSSAKARWLRALAYGLALLSALMFVAAVAALVHFWQPDRPVDTLKARWAPPPSRFVAVQGLGVHVRDVGPRDDPSPIVLVHGTSASLHTWEGWVADLSKSRRVITFDLPGFGLTGPNAEGDYAIERYASFLLALLERLKVDGPIVLGGNSLGGEVAWGFAARHPQRVAQLILVDAAGYTLVPKRLPIGFVLASLPGVRWTMQYVLPRAAVEQSVRSVYGDPSKITPALVDRYFDLTLREGNRLALGQRLQQRENGREAERIKTLKMPTLILWGGRDQLIPPEHAQWFARDIAGSQLVMFDALGHVPHEEDPAATLKLVRAFLGLPP
jgi:pimeloyl-ACP methyl ester carboxylesterase